MPTDPSVLKPLTSGPPHYAGATPMNSDAMQLSNLAAWHLLRIGNTGMLAAPMEIPTSATPGSTANPLATQTRPWIHEPPGSVPFDEQGMLALPLSATGTDFPVLITTVPIGFDGVIRWISNNVINSTPAFTPGGLAWKITINNRPVRNFGTILQEKGTIAQGRRISPIRVFSGDILSYVVQGPAGGPALTGQTVCSLSGYYYPSKGIS